MQRLDKKIARFKKGFVRLQAEHQGNVLQMVDLQDKNKGIEERGAALRSKTAEL